MKGGGKPYLPIPADVTDPITFQAMFDLVSITAHGSQDGTVFLVPENVFICFRGPSGATIERRRHQDAVLNQFRYLNPGETVAQYHERVYTGLRDKTLFREFLAPANDPFAPGSMSIYEPGDVIQNIGLQMHNLAYPYALIGIWKVPLPSEYLDRLEGLNATYDALLDAEMDNKRAETPDGMLRTALLAKGVLSKDIPEQIKQIREVQKNELKPVINTKLSAEELAFSQLPQNAQHWLRLPEENPTLYDMLQNMRASVLYHEPLITKKYTFIVIEACREAFELRQMKLLSGPEHVSAMELRRPEAERVVALEEATRKFYTGSKNGIASSALGIAKGLKPSRRRSLAVRNVPGICYRTLFLLSKDSLRTLTPTTPALQKELEILLSGRPIASSTLDTLTAPAQVGNIALEGLNYSQRFYPGEIVKVVASGAFAIVKDVIVISEVSGSNATGGASSIPSVRYQITILNPENTSIKNIAVAPANIMKTTVEEQEVFEATRMSLNNTQQKALSFERAPLAVASAPAFVATTIPIGSAYGKGFYIPSSLAPYQANIESQLEKIEMKLGTLKARNRLEYTTGTKARKKVELLPELGYPLDESAKGYKQLRFKVLENDGSSAFINPVVFKKSSGGSRKTRKAKGRGQSTKFLRGKFCRCIKKVSKTVKTRKANKEKAAIGICVKSVLGTRKRTLYKFSCKKRKLQTQDPFHMQ